jgi:hypothetical protein
VLALALDRPAEAAAHLERAVARHAELDLPLLEAESRIELARACAVLGEESAAAAARTAARTLAADHGAAGLVRRAAQP